jgi:hypothetical protein
VACRKTLMVRRRDSAVSNHEARSSRIESGTGTGR